MTVTDYLRRVLILCLLCIGCDDPEGKIVTPGPSRGEVLVSNVNYPLPPGVTVHEAHSPDAPARVNRQPVVIDDPQEIENCRLAFERESAKFYRQAMDHVRQGEHVFSEHLQALRDAPEKAFSELKAVLQDDSASVAARAKAAETLLQLRDAGAPELIFAGLASGSAPLRAAVLRSLRAAHYYARDLLPAARVGDIVALLNDSDESVVDAAADVCGAFEIQAAEPRLLAILQADKQRRRRNVAENLACCGTTEASAKAVLPYLLREESKRTFLQGHLLGRFMQHADPAVSQPVRRAFYEFLLKFPEQEHDQTWIRQLAGAADRDAIPILDEIRRNAKDVVSRMYAVQALARLNPERAADLWVAHIQEVGLRDDLVRQIAPHVQEADFDRIVLPLVKLVDDSNKPLGSQLVRWLLDQMGPQGRAIVAERIDRCDDDARKYAHWKIQGLDARTALEELRAAGVIRLTADELIEERRRSWVPDDLRGPFDPNSPELFEYALGSEHIVLMFDVETGEIPCQHHQLVPDFAGASRGAFNPQYPTQVYHRQSERDYDAPYTVQFVYRGRLYRVGAENYGDWYDVEAMLRLMNFAIETAGQPERFIGLTGGGQVATFVFADPDKFVPLARKYFLSLADDLSKPMREGMEYENRVIRGSR